MARAPVSLVIAMPVYNEAGCIEKVCRSWLGVLDGFSSGKLLVVDDGSKDETKAILERLAKEDERLVVVSQANAGHGAALLKAYRGALEQGADWVFQVDSDDQFVPEDFAGLWERHGDSRFILGFREIRRDALHRLVITNIVRLLLLLLYGVWIPDSNIPYRLMRADYLRALLAELPLAIFAPNIFLAVLAAKSGERLYSVPVRHLERNTGQVSIVRLRLLKVCVRSAAELASFRLGLNAAVRRVKAATGG